MDWMKTLGFIWRKSILEIKDYMTGQIIWTMWNVSPLSGGVQQRMLLLAK